MSSSSGVKILFGTGGIGNPGAFQELSAVNELLDTLATNNVKLLDTARLYGNSEATLGKAEAAKKGFNIDTKHPGAFQPGTATRERVEKEGLESLERLNVKQVDVYFIHAPDTSIPFSEQLAAINELHQKGAFKRFGLSNFTPEQVQEVYDHCKQNNYPLPTVYQGNYNPVARHIEQTLFPVLRKLSIAFHAYSPIAGGFLTKTKQQIEEGAGRFNKDTIGGLYHGMYARPTLLEALEDWAQIAQDEGVKPAELAYRWVRFDSALKPEHDDGIIIGASKLAQVEETIKALDNGPLSEKARKRIDEVWEKVKNEAPTDNHSR